MLICSLLKEHIARVLLDMLTIVSRTSFFPLIAITNQCSPAYDPSDII